MPLAIFGIENSAINLAVTLAIVCLVALWLALIVFTFVDARRRIADPFLVGCATAASFFPFIGTIVYTILRPAEFLEDAHEREVEVRASEIRTRHLEANSCHKCGHPTESDFMRCPSCRTRLKEECPTCSKPVGLDWKLCPYCETALVAPPKRSSRSGSSKSSKSSSRSSKSSRPEEAAGEETKRSSRRSSKESGRSAEKPSGRSSEKPSSRSSRSGSSSRSSSSRKPSSSSSRSEDTRETPASRSSSDPDATQESRRPSRPARRKPVATDEDSSSKPINSGDTPAPSRTPDSR